jgi:predicted DNA-binding transcriptional regulator AlpA
VPETIPLRPDPAAADPGEDLHDRPAARPKGARPAPTPATEALLVDTRRAAALCGVSPPTWYRLKAAGKTPAPVKLGRTLYRLQDLRLWVSWGCPPRKEFEARKAAENGSGRK